MAFSTPSYGQGGSYTAAQDRGLTMGHARTAGVRRLIPAAVGVMQGDLAVSSTGTTNGSVVIALGDCFIDDGTGAGLYFSTNATSTVTVGPFAANSSGTSRTDLVYVQVTDTGVGSPTIAATIATGSTTVPAKAIGLATIAIPNGFTTSTQVQNAWITDTRKKAQMFDLSVTSTTAVAAPLSGNMIFDTSTAPSGKLKIYNTAGAWEQVATTNGAGFTNADMATGYTMLYQSATAPASPTDGQLWFDTTNKRLLEYRVSDTSWQRIGYITSTGRTGITLTRTTNQAIGTGTPTAISFTAETFDSDSFVSSYPATSVTIPSGFDGLYAITARVRWIDDPTSNATTWLRIGSGGTTHLINGDAARGSYSYNLGSSFPAGVSAVLPLAAGDTIATNVYHNFGANRNAQATLDIYRIGL